MERHHTIIYILLCFSILLLTSSRCYGQINAEQVTRIGQNALYFDDYLLAIQHFNQAIEAKSYLAKPYFLRAVAKYNLEDYTGAEADASDAIKRNPFMTDAYELRGVARQALGRSNEAVTDFADALKLLPHNRSLMFNKAIAEEEAGMYRESQESFDQLLREYPRYDYGYLGRAKLLLSLRDTTSAQEDLTKATSLNKNITGAYILTAQIALAQEDDSVASIALDNAIRLSPKSAGLYINRAYIKYKNDDFSGALNDYEHAIAIEPHNATAYFNRGLLRMEMYDNDRALTDFNKVIQMDPDDYRAVYNRAMIYAEKKDYERSIADLTRVIEAYPDFTGARYSRFTVYDKMGDAKKAMADYDAAMALWKNDKLKPTYDPDIDNATQQNDRSNLKDRSEKEIARRFSSLVLSENDVEIEQEFNNNDIRGRIQDRKGVISPEPPLMITYYPPNETSEKGFTVSIKEVNDLNRTNTLRHKLYVTLRENHEVANISADDRYREIDYYNSVIATGGARPIDYFGRAMENLYLHDYSKAIADLEHATAASPEFATAFFMLSTAYYRQLLATENDLDAIGASKSEHIIHQSNLRKLHDSIKHNLLTVIKLSPYNAAAYYNMGCILLDEGDLNGAKQYFTSAIGLEPTLAAAYYNRGYILLQEGNAADGTSDLSHAGELGLARSYSVLKRMNP